MKFHLLTHCFCFFLMIRRPPSSTLTATLFPYTSLFRSAGISFAVEMTLRLTGRVAWRSFTVAEMRVFWLCCTGQEHRWQRPRPAGIRNQQPAIDRARGGIRRRFLRWDAGEYLPFIAGERFTIAVWPRTRPRCSCCLRYRTCGWRDEG